MRSITTASTEPMPIMGRKNSKRNGTIGKAACRISAENYGVPEHIQENLTLCIDGKSILC